MTVPVFDFYGEKWIKLAEQHVYSSDGEQVAVVQFGVKANSYGQQSILLVRKEEGSEYTDNRRVIMESYDVTLTTSDYAFGQQAQQSVERLANAMQVMVDAGFTQGEKYESRDQVDKMTKAADEGYERGFRYGQEEGFFKGHAMGMQAGRQEVVQSISDVMANKLTGME